MNSTLLSALGVWLGVCVAACSAQQTQDMPEPGAAKLAGQAPVKVIFDTDFDGDCDDAGALAVLHALADLNEVEILGVMIAGRNEHSGPAIDAINTYYGRGDLPIGAAGKLAPLRDSRYTRVVAEKCPHDLLHTSAAQSAVELYRELLAAQPDESVTIVTVGYMTNLASLIAAPADDNRPSGKDLIRTKVKLWVCMGGNFIGQPARDDLKIVNPNFTIDKRATYAAIDAWPTPIVFAGREVCSVPSGLKAGASLRESPETNPVRVAYAAYFDGQPKDRHVADLVAVLFAVRGLGDCWNAEGRGGMILQRDMRFEWSYDRDRRHAYLLKRNDDDGQPNDRNIERVLSDLLIQPPASKVPQSR